jgi:hypothetical protein
MSTPEQLPPGSHKPNPILDVGIAVAAQVGLAVIAIVLVAALGGIWLDRTLGTRPLFTIVLIVAAGPACLYVVYWLAQKAVSKIPMPPPGTYPRGDYRDQEGGDNE